jgi:hypothetical protein
MHRSHPLLVLLALPALPALFTLLAACSGDDGVDVSDRDPRCVSACVEPAPQYDGVGRVCDTSSLARCVDECEARIAGLATICQNCLVEDSCFSPTGCLGDHAHDGSCTNNICTVSTEFGTCMFNADDQAGKLRCYQQVDPRREVACTPGFRPATECASVCI